MHVLDEAVSRTAQTERNDFSQERNTVLCYCIAWKYNFQWFHILVGVFLIKAFEKTRYNRGLS